MMRLVLLLLLVAAVVGVIVIALGSRGRREQADAVDRLLAEADVLERFGQRGRAAEVIESGLESHPGDERLRERLEQLRQ